MKIKATLVFFSLCTIHAVYAQDTLSVLYPGNSHTASSNLTQPVQGLSGSNGKTLVFDSNTTGGMIIYGHLIDPASTAKISQDAWDYVVVQEQSQVPAIEYCFGHQASSNVD